MKHPDGAFTHDAGDWQAEVWLEGPDGDEPRIVEFTLLGVKINPIILPGRVKSAIADRVLEFEQ